MPKSPEEKRAMNRDRVAKWRKANPALSAHQAKSYRERCEQDGMREVRGIYALPGHHSIIKDYASKMYLL